MRPLVFILLLASCGILRAQEQERKMMDRIMMPDRTLGSPLQSKAYSGGGNGMLEISKDANVKDYYFTRKFSLKAFDTKQFDAKGFWQGEFQFATKPASVKADSAAEKTFATKTIPVKDARESGKEFQAGGESFATRESPLRGKTSQNHLDEKYKGKEQMNIDQVRDLLNKPKL
jgi:hypothetical protein